MRLVEFASASEQLALWKLVSDSVWQAISIQTKQEQQQKAEKLRQAKPLRKATASPRAVAASPRPPHSLQQRTEPLNAAAKSIKKTATNKPSIPNQKPSIAPAGPQSPRFNQPI